MFPLAQVPTPDDAARVIERAAQTSWEAGLLALVFVASIAGLTWLLKTVLATASRREERMAARIDKLEDVQRTDLRELVAANTKAIVELTVALHARPCFWSEDHQAQFMADFRKEITDMLASSNQEAKHREKVVP